MKDKAHILFTSTVIAVLGFGLSGLSHAVDYDAESVASGEGNIISLQPYVVKAHKREQLVQNIPEAVTVLSELKIEAASVVNMESLAFQVPGLEFYSFGSRRHSIAFMRGVKNIHTGNPATGYYVDGVNYSKSYMFDFPLFDVESIEILKGPQGTLYGKNTMSGVINVYTKEPGNETQGRLGVEFASHQYLESSISIRHPLIEDRMFSSVSGVTYSHDGYVKNDTPAEGKDGRQMEGTAGRIKLSCRSNQGLDIDFTVDMQRHEGGAFPFRRTERNMFVKKGILSADPAYHYSHDFEGTAEDRFWGAALNVEYELDHHTLTWISGYRDYWDRESIDADFSPFDMSRMQYGQDEESFTHELRLTNSESADIRWIVGSYYFHDDSENSLAQEFRQGMSDNPNNPFGAETGSQLLKSTGTHEGTALFGQASIQLLDHLEFTAGLRYEKGDASMDRIKTLTPVSGIPAKMEFPHATNDYDLLLPKVSLSWEMDAYKTVYFTFSSGQRSGGFNTTADPNYLSFDEETSKLYELGSKLVFANDRLNLDFALFYMEINSEQITQFDADTNTPYIVNAGESHRLGFESELNWALSPVWGLNAGLSLLETEYDQFSDPVLGIDYKGNRVFGVPNYTFNFGLEYRKPWTGQWYLMARTDCYAVGNRYFDDANTVKHSPYQLINLKIGLEGDRFDIYLWSKNLADQQYAQFENTAKGITEDGAPQAFGVSFEYRF